MTSAGVYDDDELRALAVALDVLDPENPDEWEGDVASFEASVARGRDRLEARGLATFARDGGAVVDPADAAMLRAFLAPDAVIEAWIVNGTVALQREWYLGPEATVVAGPAAAGTQEQELMAIDTREVFADVFGFLDPRGSDGEGEPVRISATDLDDFCDRLASPLGGAPRASRLLNVSVGWERSPASRELQFVDAGGGGLWVVATVEPDGGATNDDIDVELTPATRAQIVEQLLAVLTAPALR